MRWMADPKEVMPWYEQEQFQPGGRSHFEGPLGRHRRSDEHTLRLVRSALKHSVKNPSLVCSDICAIVEGRI